MKNKVILTAFLLIIPFFVTACTVTDVPVIGGLLSKIPFLSPGGSSSKTGTITVWGLWESREVMDSIIKKYEEKNPGVKVNYDDRSIMAVNDYKDTVLTRATQKDAADVVLVHDSWLPQVKDSFAPLTSSTLTPQSYSQTYYPAAFQAGVADNKIYAMPMYYDGIVLVYNKKHFAEISQQTAPTAWEEFRRLATSLTIRGQDSKIVRAGAAIGNSSNIDFSTDILGLMLAQAKVNIPNSLDSKPAQDALTFYTNFVKEDRVWSSDFPEASAAFAKEQVSMIFIPTWNLLDILVSRPDLKPYIGVAPVPQAKPEEPVSWGSFWMYAVPSGSTKKELAWDFIQYLSAEEQQLMIFSEASKYREYGAPYSISAMAPQLTSYEYLKPLLDTAPFSGVNAFASRSGNKSQTDALKTAIEGALNGGAPATLLKTAKDNFNTVAK